MIGNSWLDTAVQLRKESEQMLKEFVLSLTAEKVEEFLRRYYDCPNYSLKGTDWCIKIYPDWECYLETTIYNCGCCPPDTDLIEMKYFFQPELITKLVADRKAEQLEKEQRAKDRKEKDDLALLAELKEKYET